jgi:hypothetical protein
MARTGKERSANKRVTRIFMDQLSQILVMSGPLGVENSTGVKGVYTLCIGAFGKVRMFPKTAMTKFTV